MSTALIRQIVDREFQMFQAVSNRGGRASCQDDFTTFEIMRSSQFAAWSADMLESYLDDLIKASASGRNLLAEKYAWMMKETFPDEFKSIQASLEPLSTEKRTVIEKIMQIQTDMTAELYKQFPATCSSGRPMRQNPSSPQVTSSLVYLRGELCTYSLRTLTLYLEHLKSLKSAGRNLPIEILENTVRRYGYRSLAERENAACSTN
jgi:hypothetical protein